MARRRPTPSSRARRTLLWTTALVVVLAAGLASAVQFSDGSVKPKLGLDLAGGTEIILTPEVHAGQGTITDQTITNAITIIRDRVNANGSTEADVSSQGGRNIVVDLPGDPATQRKAVALVSQSAQMSFRAVLVQTRTKPTSSASASGTASSSASTSGGATALPSGGASGTAAPTSSATSSTTASSSAAGDRVPQALRAATSTASPSATASSSAAASASAPSGSATGPATPTASPSNDSDLAQITPALASQFESLTCDHPVTTGQQNDTDPKKPVVLCSSDGSEKFILGPVEIAGTQIKTASAGLGTNSTGSSTGQWVVNLSLDSSGTKAFAKTSTRLYGLAGSSPRDEFAIVLDGTVIEPPAIQSPITDGHAQISGNFNQTSATTLANQLKFGALPLTFHVQTTDQISALLGSQQLHRGLLAGLIGLLLVVLYSLAQYRTLGLVTVGSLVLAAVLNFLAIDLLSWYQGYRLSLAGVAGFIVSIGITADSFIVFFERVRDEVREGRPLNAAVAAGWVRGRRTIVVSDAVNFLAAATLYLLAVGNVRGFAFTLGLTTIIDLVVVFGFTHPVVVLLSGRDFFRNGHRLSGFDAEHLGRSAYAGRGRVSTPTTRAESRRAARGASAAGAADPTGGGLDLLEAPADERPAEGVDPALSAADADEARLTIAERRARREAASAESPDDPPGDSQAGPRPTSRER